MTRVEGGRAIIEPEPEQQCDDCGQLAELRPYGPGGSKVCHPCGMKDPEGMRRRMNRHLGLS